MAEMPASHHVYHPKRAKTRLIKVARQSRLFLIIPVLISAIIIILLGKMMQTFKKRFIANCYFRDACSLALSS